MSAQLYIITAKTNLHAGSGSTNAGVIDNLVQRDPSDNLPCTYASSLKGAFREFFEDGPRKAFTKILADEIFGAGLNKDEPIENETDQQKAERIKKKKNSKGTHIFHQASLLSIPVRSNNKPFYNATSPDVLQKFLDEYKLFTDEDYPDKSAINKLIEKGAAKDKPIVYHAAVEHLRIEDYDISVFEREPSASVKKLLGDNIIVMNEEDFKYQCGDLSLPVIARNNLENGESKNLWYEQIVQREARFWFYTVHFQSSDNFDNNVNERSVQIGANASIGYGICKINNYNSQLA